MNKFKFLLTCLLVIFFLQGFSQTRTVTGKIVNATDGAEVPSASISVKGSTANTTSRTDGSFSIAVPAGKVTLVITSVGFEAKELTLTANEKIFTIELTQDKKQLNEVVVTALGIKREK
jgi:ABC-type oligopeptide transport system substrate-binding subunit